jgi:glycosyltransferase involved in cell wall biosynthesis
VVNFSKQPHQHSVEKVQDYGPCLGCETCAGICGCDSIKMCKTPYGLFEYQACKPIICVSGGEPARYIEETMSGIVVKLGDYEALAKAVLHLKEDKDFAGKLGVSGARYVENNLSIEKIGSKMLILFRKVLAD